MNDERDLCPRCGSTFHCGVADAEPCACTTVRLDQTTLLALRDQYDRCLCLRCLVELRAQAQPRPQ
jgi:cysteine-rich CWC protein